MSFANGLHYRIAPSRKPHALCDWKSCRRHGSWLVVTEHEPADKSHPISGCGMMRALCGDHALSWIRQECATLKSIYRRKMPGERPPIVSVSLGSVPQWAQDIDRGSARALGKGWRGEGDPR